MAAVAPAGDEHVVGVEIGAGADPVEQRARLEENVRALDIRLTSEELKRIDAVAPLGAAAGNRYPDAGMRAVNA